MITKRWPDKAKARSMTEAAIRGINFIETLQVTEQNSPSVIREIYESFRMLGDAVLTAKGLETRGADHHTHMIDELLKLKVETAKPLNLLHELRKARHKINYEGHLPTKAELDYLLGIKKALWAPVLAEVKKLIEK